MAHQDLPDDLRRWVLEFIDHNEFGLAFETLVGGLAEARAALATPAREALASAAREMGVERSEDWLALTS
jgi:hypothetical protein